MIEPSCFHMEIQEYGKRVREYNDTDIDRFKKQTKEIVNEHLNNYSGQTSSTKQEIRNITIQIYTY